ncbi:MAG: type II toxin-antitoxin system PemK/MazF family toxin, partial [Campylobacterota bacterium]|nr:type II toxin-antitoxin system PemK/MazF family toxin [Campylobacterota bacterium]
FGKGTNFLRPVLIFKKFSQSTFLGIPLTTSKKEDIFHYKFTISKTNTENYASLTQIRVFDAKRLHHKLDKISTEEFNKLKNQLKELLNM